MILFYDIQITETICSGRWFSSAIQIEMAEKKRFPTSWPECCKQGVGFIGGDNPRSCNLREKRSQTIHGIWVEESFPVKASNRFKILIRTISFGSENSTRFGLTQVHFWMASNAKLQLEAG